MRHLLSLVVILHLFAIPVRSEVKLPPVLEEISQHLGEPGIHFSVTDREGTALQIARLLEELAKMAGDEGLPEGFSLEKLFKDLGLDGLRGSGQSSRKVGEYWHNRSFILTDGKHEGLFSLFGKAARPWMAPAMAPAGADLLLELKIDLREFEPVARKVMAQAPDEDREKMEAALKEPVAPNGQTASELFAAAEMHVAVVVWLDEKDTFEPVPGLKFPVPHGAIAIDGAGKIWEAFRDEMATHSEVIEKDGETHYLGPQEETPIGTLIPRLVFEKKSGRLWMVAREEDLAACRGQGPHFAETEAYKTVTTGFPEKGNSFVYLSQDVLQLVEERIGIAALVNPEAEAIVSIVRAALTHAKAKAGYAFAYSLMENGILGVVNSPLPDRGASFAGPQGIFIVAMLSGMATPQILKAKKNADKAKIINEMRMLSMAFTEYDAEFGNYPQSLEVLKKQKFIDEEMLFGFQQALSKTEGELIYRGKELGSASTARAKAILFYVNSPIDGFILVAHADGSVREIPAAALEEALKK